MTTEATTAPANGQADQNALAVQDRPPVGGKLADLKSYDHGENRLLFDRATFEQAWSVASMFSKSKLVPAHFQGQPENCFIACQLAYRFKMDPFMVMQGTYVVSGKPGFEGKFIIALVNASKLFEDPLDFDFTGTPGKEDWVCTASAKRAKTGKLCSLPFHFAVAKAEGWLDKGGSKWKTMPHQMMMYRAATFFARVYCPEVIMGMQSADELEDIGPDPTIADLPQGRSSFREPAGTCMTPLPSAVVDKGTGEVLGVMKSDGEFVPEKPADDGKPEPLFGKGGNTGTVDRNLSNPRGKSPAL